MKSLNPVEWVVLIPLLSALVCGLFGRQMGRRATHSLAISAMAIVVVISLSLFKQFVMDGASAQVVPFYTWLKLGGYQFDIGFLLDGLSVTMLFVVSSVSFLVHVYTIGYMEEDAGYQRFFSYISLFTFAMLMLVTSHGFLQLFFGWEAVGLVSYLLIGFWHHKESAILGNFKAFLVNRVGDFGFLLGIAALLKYTGTLDYHEVFAKLPSLVGVSMTLWPGCSVMVLNLIGILLFIGAMGKSAQIPLHVWLPESMEGPTPISALIHAATMVTAGVFMVARLHALYAIAPAANAWMLILGASGAFWLGLVGVVQFDIKRVVAYSTLSQLGYMIAAMGAGAWGIGLFHLVTHAFFKALLFLAAGSVIVALHHEQDMRQMGGLASRLPVTYITSLLGSLALCGLPPFSGFYSKDLIIEAVRESHGFGHSYAAWCLTAGVFVTSLYTFRMLFMTFHGEYRGHGHYTKLHEPSWVIGIPLIALAIPSVILGAWILKPALLGPQAWWAPWLGSKVAVSTLEPLSAMAHPAWGFALHAMHTVVFWLAASGIVVAYILYRLSPALPGEIAEGFAPLYAILQSKYGFDAFNDAIFVRGSVVSGELLDHQSEQRIIDRGIVHGLANFARKLAQLGGRLQTGFVYHTTLWVLLGWLGALWWLLHVLALRLW